MKVIVPCAGRSSRFPNMAPKWMLPDTDGVPMIARAVEGLRVDPADLIVTMLREHADRFDAIAGLERAFGRPIRCVVLDTPTASQSETVVRTLEATALDEPFLVKDSDNHFELPSLDDPANYVSVASLNDFDNINARNKSYVQVDQEGVILNMREKSVISDLFSVGGYFFRSPDEFRQVFHEISANALAAGELYLSEIISYMVLNGGAFRARRVANYQDWGTIHEWRRKLEHRRTFFVSLDGFLFERGSRFFSPSFADAEPRPGAVAAVKRMVAGRHGVVYLSIRDEAEEGAATRARLAALGLPDGPILFGLSVAQWTLLTAPHSSLPFTSARAFELDPGAEGLAEKLDLIG